MTDAEERVLRDLDAARQRLAHARDWARGTQLQPFVDLIDQEAKMTEAMLVSCQVALLRRDRRPTRRVFPDDGQPS